MSENLLFISDLQAPFCHEHALQFCRAVKKEFRISPENVYCVGDEVDQYFGSTYKKDPDALHSPTSELRAARELLQGFYRAFPQMKLAISNHGLRWAKKAFEAEIPSQMLRPYQEVIGAPKGWAWKDRWVIKTRGGPILMIHGMGYSGMSGARNAAIDAGMNTVIGHIHSHAGVARVKTAGQELWGMNTGCLIDEKAFAFNYGREHRHKPILGVGVVIDQGRTPIFLPLERFL